MRAEKLRQELALKQIQQLRTQGKAEKKGSSTEKDNARKREETVDS